MKCSPNWGHIPCARYVPCCHLCPQQKQPATQAKQAAAKRHTLAAPNSTTSHYYPAHLLCSYSPTPYQQLRQHALGIFLMAKTLPCNPSSLNLYWFSLHYSHTAFTKYAAQPNVAQFCDRHMLKTV